MKSKSDSASGESDLALMTITSLPGVGLKISTLNS